MLKNNKGITLIALVVTIIVLLILATVSIAMLTGNNGILTQSRNAKTDTEKAEAVERINLALNATLSAAMEDSSNVPTVANVTAHDSIFSQTDTKYKVDDTTTPGSITITYKNGSITVTGSILKTSPFTITAAQK